LESHVIDLEKSINFVPISISYTDGKSTGIITNSRKIVIVNLLNGKWIYETNHNPSMPFLKVIYVNDHLFAVNVDSIFICSVATREEKVIEFVPSPTTCFATYDLLVVGDINGGLTVFDFSGEKKFVIKTCTSETDTDDSTPQSLVQSMVNCIQSIGKFEDAMVCFQATGVTLFELKPDSTPINYLPIEGKVSSYREFSTSVQLIVNENELWLWSPSTERSKTSSNSFLSKSKKYPKQKHVQRGVQLEKKKKIVSPLSSKIELALIFP